MSIATHETHPNEPRAGEPRLSDEQRTTLMNQLESDGYFVLPGTLSADLNEQCISAIDRITQQAQRENPTQKSVKRQNCVDLDPAFLRLMMYQPALQLAYDAFGPMFHLCQSNFVSRARVSTRTLDFVSGTPWHADGPRPNLFPRVRGEHGPAMGLHYLKFGYFLRILPTATAAVCKSCVAPTGAMNLTAISPISRLQITEMTWYKSIARREP
jgi:hypothetical protein